MIIRLICFLLILLSFTACNQKKAISIEGAWRQIEHKTFTGDSVVIDFPGKSEVDAIKIWSGNRFMFVARVKTDTVVEENYGTGTFKLEGNRYEENINILGYKPWEGKTIKMTLEIRNDTLIQTYPVDDNGVKEKEWACIEKYLRLK
ncbi:MAG: hypothetical protein HXX13_07510 [Bacteroidetes bacterium]|nr:hypothetical protein [Bacteroidota bacterium]